MIPIMIARAGSDPQQSTPPGGGGERLPAGEGGWGTANHVAADYADEADGHGYCYWGFPQRRIRVHPPNP